jgi:phosphate butyryltransferase
VKQFDDIEKKVKNLNKPVTVFCVQPYDESTMHALNAVKSWGTSIRMVFFGEKNKIFEAKKSGNYDFIDDIEIMEGMTEETNTANALRYLKNDENPVLMKGHINTAGFLKTIIQSEFVKESGRLISHISCLEIPKFERLLFITDGTVNIAPELKDKVAIINNALNFARSIGIERPKVAVIGINEQISTGNKDLKDAAILSKMGERGQFGVCDIDGPMPLDTAINKQAALTKKITSPIGGKADILVCSNLESAANLIKGLVHLASSKTAGLLLGTEFPVVLTSRSDETYSKEISLAMAILNGKKEPMKT